MLVGLGLGQVFARIPVLFTLLKIVGTAYLLWLAWVSWNAGLADLFGTARSWYRGEPFVMVQLLYPDRNGFMPYEVGYDRRMRFAQPVVGDVAL